MNARTAPNDLAELARMFAARARPVPGSRPGAENDPCPIEVEVRIGVKVREAVRTRAVEQDQRVAAVARAVLFQAAAKVNAATVAEHRRSRNAAVAAAATKARTKAYEAALTAGADEAAAQSAGHAAAQEAADTERNRRLPLREYVGTEARYRLRFVVPRAAYELARDAIQASGVSVAMAVEDGLKQYARTGNLNR